MRAEIHNLRAEVGATQSMRAGLTVRCSGNSDKQREELMRRGKFNKIFRGNSSYRPLNHALTDP